MRVLRVVVRVGVLWVMSLLVAVAGMELGHRFVAATGRGETGPLTHGTTSAVSFREELAR